MPDSLGTGEYTLAAYTEQMKARGSDNYFKRPISVREHARELFVDPECLDSLYRPGSKAMVRILVSNELDQPLEDIPVSYRVEAAGRKVAKGEGKTGAKGFLEVAFTIPEDTSRHPVILEAETDFRGHQETKKLVIPTTTLALNLQFFPEGGDLIEGIPSRVAFKATDRFGNPVEVEGELLDQEGRVLDRIKSYYAGTGVFRVDSSNRDLKVRLTKPFSIKKFYSLPEPVEEGCQINVEAKNKEFLQLKVRSSGSFSGRKLTLVACMNGEVRWSKTFSGSKERELTIPTKSLPMGVLTLTLFDGRLLPLAERPVFVNRHKRLFVEVEADTTQYRKKQKVTLDIRVTDHQGNPSPAELSLAAFDLSRLDDPSNAPSLLSHHYLKDALRGKVYRPDAYFVPTPRADTALDHLLMTQGWRRYQWEKVFSYDPKEKEEELPFLTGRILKRKGKGAKNATVELFTPKFKIKQEMMVKLMDSEHTPAQLSNPEFFRHLKLSTDRKGYFEVTGEQFREVIDTGQVLVRARRRNGSPDVLFRFPLKAEDEHKPLLASTGKTQEEIQMAFALSPLINPVQQETVKKDRYTNFDDELIMIEEVTITAHRKIKIPDEVRKRNYQVIEKNGEELEKEAPGINSFEELIKHISAGAMIDGNKIFLRGNNSLLRNQGATIFVDGFPKGTNFRTIDGWMNYQQIKEVKIISNAGAALRYVSGELAIGGVILIETKHGLDKEKLMAKEEQFKDLITVEGYQVQKEFYSPTYHSKEEKNNRVDLRNTLYWNPMVEIYKSGKGKVTFYTSDLSMKVLCTINGRNGRNLGSAREAFVVY